MKMKMKICKYKAYNIAFSLSDLSENQNPETGLHNMHIIINFDLIKIHTFTQFFFLIVRNQNENENEDMQV